MTDRRAPLSLIAAISPDRVIGKAGGIPWHVPEDLKYFKRLTTGHAVIMGRRTWDEVGRPLPGRRNLVVSRQAGLALEGAEVFADLESAIAAARETDPEPMVIGGGAIYRLALPLATRIYLTEIPREVEGDTTFPDLDPGAWVERSRREGETPGIVFRVLERRDR